MYAKYVVEAKRKIMKALLKRSTSYLSSIDGQGKRHYSKHVSIKDARSVIHAHLNKAARDISVQETLQRIIRRKK